MSDEPKPQKLSLAVQTPACTAYYKVADVKQLPRDRRRYHRGRCRTGNLYRRRYPDPGELCYVRRKEQYRTNQVCRGFFHRPFCKTQG